MAPDTHRHTTGGRRALIVEDHPLYGDALALAIAGAGGISHVEHADRLSTALSRLDRKPDPDIVSLDLSLPDARGIEALVRIGTSHPHVPIIIVSSHTEPETISAALSAGAKGFVPKNARHDVIREAFDTVLSGEMYRPDQAHPDDATRTRGVPSDDDVRTRLASLTRQQERILQQLCEGKLNKQIAWDLSIRESTVKAHVTAIMRKLGVQSRTQAVLMAAQGGYRCTLNLPQRAT